MTIEQTIVDIINTKNTFIGNLAMDIDNCQCVKSMSGSIKHHFGCTTYDYPKFIVYVRGTNNKETLERAKQIYDKVKHYVGDGFVIFSIRLPMFVGRDAKDRSVYNFQLEYQLGGY